MPELPEVESIRRSLQPIAEGRLIADIEVLTPGVLISDLALHTGWLIESLDRRGKYLIFRLGGAKGEKARLVVHLRMTGRLLIDEQDKPAVQHDHVRIRLDPAASVTGANPVWLRYHDPRRFGRLWLLPAKKPAGTRSTSLAPPGLSRLGPEPLGRSFSSRQLAGRLARHRKASLKAVLLDQTVVAGLGNIYADESLFAAGLYPARSAGSLDDREVGSLARAIRQVLRKAIDCQGTSLRDYVNGWNQKGTFQECLMVYGRANQPCRRCGHLLKSARLAGRTTCWCPICQPQPAGPHDD